MNAYEINYLCAIISDSSINRIRPSFNEVILYKWDSITRLLNLRYIFLLYKQTDPYFKSQLRKVLRSAFPVARVSQVVINESCFAYRFGTALCTVYMDILNVLWLYTRHKIGYEYLMADNNVTNFINYNILNSNCLTRTVTVRLCYNILISKYFSPHCWIGRHFPIIPFSNALPMHLCVRRWIR